MSGLTSSCRCMCHPRLPPGRPRRHLSTGCSPAATSGSYQKNRPVLVTLPAERPPVQDAATATPTAMPTATPTGAGGMGQTGTHARFRDLFTAATARALQVVGRNTHRAEPCGNLTAMTAAEATATTRRVALVTGASRGIGAATAVGLARRGWDVAITYRERASAADEVVRRCQAQGGQALAVKTDMASHDDIGSLFTQVDDRLGPIDALVNNAGIVAPRSTVADLSPRRLEQMMAVNVIGPFLCAGQAVRRMSTAAGGAGGAIVNVSSAAARLGGPGEYVDYAASKGAIDTMTLGLAREVALEGIRVNAIRPGVIDTEIHASGGQPDRAARVAAVVPMARAGRVEEVAASILWLCCDAPDYLTGSLIDVSGGR